MNSNKRKENNLAIDMETDSEIEELERKLGYFLAEYDVEYPSETEMMKTIDSLRPIVPVKENKWKIMFTNLFGVIRQSCHEMFFISPMFWSSNGLLFLVALVAVFLTELSPYLTIMLLAPIPTITGLLEVLKSRNTGMAELEMSFKYSLQEVILSKMLVVGGYNFLINFIFTFGIALFYPDIWVWKMFLYWVTPFTVITAISFIAVSRFRQVYGVTAGLAVWVGIGVLMSQSNIVDKIERIPMFFYILITITAATVVLIQMIHILKRGVNYEFNN